MLLDFSQGLSNPFTSNAAADGIKIGNKGVHTNAALIAGKRIIIKLVHVAISYIRGSGEISQKSC
jgi:hypothetical protein